MGALIPCIISGGAGTRLWPISREALPKPFMLLPDGQSLLQKTFLRAAGLPEVERIMTVTNREVLFRTQDEYRPLNSAQLKLDFLLEPFGRNTAPAIACAALQAERLYGPDSQLLVLPADHLIADSEAFNAAVADARQLATQGYLVTFGLKPERAETGFGYIQTGEPLSTLGQRVTRFVEKPNLATAQTYVDSGQYLWNGGMFCLQVDHLLAELQQHAPEVLRLARECLDASPTLQSTAGSQCELTSTLFAQVPDISIDYALMEQSAKVAVVPCTLGWSDIGSWQALAELLPSDSQGNRLQGEVICHDSHNCFVQSADRLIATVGLDNLMIVDTPDALLVADASRCQEVKFIAQELKKRGHDAYRLHRTVNRPWGTYSVIEESSRYKIKRIEVRPGASLSLQMHHHRSEHWIVVSGMATVVNGDQEFLLSTNQSTFIPAGHRHRLSNPGVIDLVMIEVQSGEYLAEDDIVRFDDIYGRAPAAEQAN